MKYLEPQCVKTLRSRTPHGVRGLKCVPLRNLAHTNVVAPLTGCVD